MSLRLATRNCAVHSFPVETFPVDQSYINRIEFIQKAHDQQKSRKRKKPLIMNWLAIFRDSRFSKVQT